MTMDYIRRTYGVPAKRGARVLLRDGREGVVTSASHYVRVRVNGEKRVHQRHPLDLAWIDAAWTRKPR